MIFDSYKMYKLTFINMNFYYEEPRTEYGEQFTIYSTMEMGMTTTTSHDPIRANVKFELTRDTKKTERNPFGFVDSVGRFGSVRIAIIR